MLITTNENLGEPVSYLEGGYAHLATKADVDSRFARTEAQIAQLETRIFIRMSGLIVIAFAAVVGLQNSWYDRNPHLF